MDTIYEDQTYPPVPPLNLDCSNDSEVDADVYEIIVIDSSPVQQKVIRKRWMSCPDDFKE